MPNRIIILADHKIEAMLKGVRRVRRIEREWLATTIRWLEQLHPGECLVIQRIDNASSETDAAGRRS